MDRIGPRSGQPDEQRSGLGDQWSDQEPEDTVEFDDIPAGTLEAFSSPEKVAEWNEQFRRFLQGGDRTVGIRRLWLPDDLWDELVDAVNELYDAIPVGQPDRLAGRRAAAKLWFGLARRDAPAQAAITVTRAIVVGYVAALHDARDGSAEL